jgi:hypothetical protein
MRKSGDFAEILFLMILKMELTIIVVAVVTMPSRKGIADNALADWLVVVKVLSWLCSLFLWPRLWLHKLCLKEILDCKRMHALVYSKNTSR